MEIVFFFFFKPLLSGCSQWPQKTNTGCRQQVSHLGYRMSVRHATLNELPLELQQLFFRCCHFAYAFPVIPSAIFHNCEVPLCKASVIIHCLPSCRFSILTLKKQVTVWIIRLRDSCCQRFLSRCLGKPRLSLPLMERKWLQTLARVQLLEMHIWEENQCAHSFFRWGEAASPWILRLSLHSLFRGFSVSIVNAFLHDVHLLFFVNRRKAHFLFQKSRTQS